MTTGLVDRTAGVGEAAREPAAWRAVCATLRSELGEDSFGSYIAPAQLKRAPGGDYTLVTTTGVARDWIRRNAWRRLGELWIERQPDAAPLGLRCRQEFEALGGEETSRPAPAPPAGARAASPLARAPAPTVPPSGLQDRYQFDSFVTGPSNEFAVSVAQRIASWADGCFNPVLFHGPYGFGKTHLLNAIAWEAHRTQPGRKVVYMTAERFTQTFVRAVMERAAPAFKDEMRGADLLLVDDVHFIGGKKNSEEELFHTLIAMMGEGRRVVFASDRPPQALAEVDARLRSHLGAGLVCGIEAADRSLRISIAQRKLVMMAKSLGVDPAARADVIALLADRFPSSIRELEGGLNTLMAKAGERLGALTADEAQTVLRSHLRGGVERKVTVDEIQKTVADHYGLSKEDLLSERRTRAVARPRQAAMYLAKHLTVRSYPDIGRRFGGRDHTTVLHAVRRIEALRAEDPTLAADLDAITRKLKD